MKFTIYFYFRRRQQHKVHGNGNLQKDLSRQQLKQTSFREIFVKSIQDASKEAKKDHQNR